MRNINIEEILQKLQKFIEKEDYKGWDPYDALNSKLINKITSFHPFAQRVAIHLLKNSPINLRDFFKIEKDYNPTALSLFIDGYVNMYHIYEDKQYLYKAEILKNKLYSLACINNETEIGWGRNFKFITTKETHELNKPLTFLNAKLTLSLLNLYEITKDNLIIENTKKAIFSIIKNGKVFKTKRGIFIGYSSDNNPRFIYNASILTSELIIKYLFITKKEDEKICDFSIKNLAYELINTILKNQDIDGKWYYGFTNDFKILKNIDFHQGFIIDSLLEISKYTNYRKNDILKAYKNGINFMIKEQITDNGIFKWRLPKIYPIDIHNQAQGIISLSKAISKIDCQKLNKILEYTIDNFYNKNEGYFYYQKHKFYKIKIPYIRWGEGWMFFALSEYVKNKKQLEKKCAE
ncbi:polysaccharide biosynthesis protein VpsJ [Nitratiruptor sp. YY08-26]|uniref:hypothetical protein n=1 Tax=unclassified Nitratiruptor TaxID=2624044 RepID=UPI001914F41A|nr:MULTISPECIES: hypothetical protein [unclassified Nitratiruptor]BCD62077.1 polysaccharide biosynthesis protein VpsJ [Nitratiruptor sp. YY08-13]BCD66013.1 polysaccharide biosynthesis protein VpsJ [Nitratiruptor sp. YY08-26]